MPNERIQRRIDALLDQADAAVDVRNWTLVLDRARTVLSLDPDNTDAQTFLAAAQRNQADVDAPLPSPPGPSASAPVVAEQSSSPTTFANGRYVVLSVLRQGGMGTVYQVRDTRLNRICALKTIRAEHLASPEAAGRFFRDAQTLARLHHPNILTLFDSGQDGDTYFLVMELGGPDLESLLEFAAGPLPIEQVIEVSTGMARALEFAHQQGIVHRDMNRRMF